MNAAEHLELHLGQMDRGWSSSSVSGVHACLFRDQPVPGAITLTTLGLGNTILSMQDGRTVRQELLFAVHAERSPDEFASLLLHLADGIIATGRALLRGEVLALGSKLATDTTAEAVYATMPSVFPDALATLNGTAPPTVFVWIVPLLPSEVTFVNVSGWSKFEDRLESAQPDLFDISRPPVTP